ncbi:MAG: S8 family serine peptidase [Anaerolineales bacterium]|nr:S8 family serine peptidase [Anaerolineales bacterium]
MFKKSRAIVRILVFSCLFGVIISLRVQTTNSEVLSDNEIYLLTNPKRLNSIQNVSLVETNLEVTANNVTTFGHKIFLPIVLGGANHIPAILLAETQTEASGYDALSLATSFGATEIEQIDGTTVYRIKFPQNTDIQQIGQAITETSTFLYAEPEYIFGIDQIPQTIPNDPRFSDQWALTKIEASQAWNITQGSNEVIIAIIDTGIDYNHPDLINNLTDSSTWYDFGEDDNDPKDVHGHGTHVAGIAAATGNNNIGVAGISWQTRIMPIKVSFNTLGQMTSQAVASGIRFATDQEADIINLSLGGPSASNAIQSAINYAHQHNVVVVAAAGNDDSSNRFYPAAGNYVISVAATDNDDKKSSFSNYGSWVDISAPGSDILSTMPTYFVSLTPRAGLDYGELGGTSMASPYVAGLASLVKARNPGWSPEQIEANILNTADNIDLQNGYYIGQLGAGRINAYEAVLIGTGDATVCMGHNATIVGTEANDTLVGTPSDDVIAGKGGDDAIDGGGGNDIICGNEGNDIINGGPGDDMINGNQNDDTITGGDGNDFLRGGKGNDNINGNGGFDEIYGDLGNDILYGGQENDVINGGQGDDQIFGNLGDDTVNGNTGQDIIEGNEGNDVLRGGKDNDTITGGENNDWLFGDLGDDAINGNMGNDIIEGGDGNDFLRGGQNNDTINGNDGNDEIYGDLGDDTINGNMGNDIIEGGDGNDSLRGGQNNDAINGNDGNDEIYGDLGDDTINGNNGDDTIRGGDGFDTCVNGPDISECEA